METIVPGAALRRVHVLGAGQKAIDQNQLRQQFRPGMREHIGSLSAHVVAGEIDLGAAEMFDERGDVCGDGGAADEPPTKGNAVKAADAETRRLRRFMLLNAKMALG
jgi:hypothetical protein